VTAAVNVRPAPIANLELEYVHNDVDLDEGDFVTRIGRVRLQNDFTPDLSLSQFLQFDNVSDTIGLNSRLRWILKDGNEVFLVLNQGWPRDGQTVASLATEVSFKVAWRLRF